WMPSGWIRWMFEQYEFPFEVVYPKALDAGDLNSRFDVLVFVGGAIPPAPSPSSGRAENAEGRGEASSGAGGRSASAPGGDTGQAANTQPAPESIPAEFRDRLGSVTGPGPVPQLGKF